MEDILVTFRNVTNREGAGWKTIASFFPLLQWFGLEDEKKQYDSRWVSSKTVPKGLEFNSTVSKQVRQKTNYNIGNIIGDIGTKELSNIKFPHFKKATVGNMEITGKSAGKIPVTFRNVL
jgi:hypothetical protein